MNVDKEVVLSRLKVVLFGLFVFVLSFLVFYVYVFSYDYNSVSTYTLDTESDRDVNILELSSNEISDGKKIDLNPSLEAWISMEGNYYSFALSETFPSSDKASIYVKELPLNVVFEKGQERKFDLNSDGYYDVSIYLNSVSVREAEFLFQKTDGEVSAGDSVMRWFDNFQGLVSEDVERHNYLLLIFFVLIALLLVFVIYFSIPYVRSYIHLRKIKKRKSYSEVMGFLIKEFDSSKRKDKVKAKRIYSRMKFVYDNLKPQAKFKFNKNMERVGAEVNKWKDI